MKSIEVTLEGETATILANRGNVSIEGYDLEDERLALILNGGFGEGMGFLLIAIDEAWRHTKFFPQGLKTLDSDINRANQAITSTTYLFAPRNDIMLRYFSFSPNLHRRLIAADMGVDVSDYGVIDRQVRDPHKEVANIMATRANLLLRHYQVLANHPNQEVRYYLAMNRTLPLSILKKLSHDKEAIVRIRVAQNEIASYVILKGMLDDEDEGVRVAIFQHRNFPYKSHEKISIEGSHEQRVSLARTTPFLSIIRTLEDSDDMEVLAVLNENPVYRMDREDKAKERGFAR